LFFLENRIFSTEKNNCLFKKGLRRGNYIEIYIIVIKVLMKQANVPYLSLPCFHSGKQHGVGVAGRK